MLRDAPASPRKRGLAVVSTRALVLVAIFCGSLAVYLSSLNATIDSGDILPNYLLTKSIVHTGDGVLDEYQSAIDHYRWLWGFRTVRSGIPFEIFTPAGRLGSYAVDMSFEEASVVSAYPPGASFLASAPYFLTWHLLPRIATEEFIAFFKVLSAIFVALSAVLMFRGLCTLVSRRAALLLVFVYALCTSVWSVASQDLWQHPAAILMLSLFLSLFLQGSASNRPYTMALSALPLAFSVSCRLTNGIFVALLLGYLLLFHRKAVIPAVLLSFLGLLPLFVYGLETLNVLVSTGGYAGRYQGFGAVVAALKAGLPGLLVSPARGLLIYSPVLLLSVLALGQVRTRTVLLAALCSGGLLLAAAAWPEWWGGGCYSYRLIVEIVPFLIVLLAFVWQRLGGSPIFRAGLLVLGLASAYIQVIGAYEFDYSWEITMRQEAEYATGTPPVWIPAAALWDFRHNPIAWYHRKFWTGEGLWAPIPLHVSFSDGVELTGYRLGSQAVSPQGRVHLTLYWRASAPIGESYTVFTHIVDEGGMRIWGQVDSRPGDNDRPTTGWQVGEIIEDEYLIPLVAEIDPGTYWVEVGLYRPETAERLVVSGRDSDPAARRVVLGPIQVR